MTSQEKAINLRCLFLPINREKKKKKTINTFNSFLCMYWYVSIFSENYFWPQYMYHKMSPNNGFCWCPLGKLSHLGLEQLFTICQCCTHRPGVKHVQFQACLFSLDNRACTRGFQSWNCCNKVPARTLPPVGRPRAPNYLRITTNMNQKIGEAPEASPILCQDIP